MGTNVKGVLGEKLGMTAKAVESAIARARQQVRENRESA